MYMKNISIILTDDFINILLVWWSLFSQFAELNVCALVLILSNCNISMVFSHFIYKFLIWNACKVMTSITLQPWAMPQLPHTADFSASLESGIKHLSLNKKNHGWWTICSIKISIWAALFFGLKVNNLTEQASTARQKIDVKSDMELLQASSFLCTNLSSSLAHTAFHNDYLLLVFKEWDISQQY